MTSSGIYIAILLTFCGSLCLPAPAHTRQFELGSLYSFSYSSWVTLNEPQKGFEPSPKDVGFKVDLNIGLLPVWQNPSNPEEQLIELKLASPKLSVKARIAPTPSEFVSNSSRVDQIKSSVFYIYREGGKIKKIFKTENENLSVVNIKKGIASLFQYQANRGPATFTEVDSSGLCDVSYVQEKRVHFSKTKTNCKPIQTLPFYNHTSKVLGAVLNSFIECSYMLSEDDAILNYAESWETHTLGAQLRPEKGIEVIARQRLNRTGISPSSSKIYSGRSVNDIITKISSDIKQSLVGEGLAVVPPPRECIQCKSLIELVDIYHPSLLAKNLATQSACIAYLKLLRKVRESSKENIKQVLKIKRNANILKQLLDIVGAAQTVQAHEAAKEVIKFSGPHELPERYLMALALNTHPLESVIEDLLNILNRGVKEEKIYDSIVLTMASMARTFSKNQRNKNQKIVNQVLSYLTSGLEDAKTLNIQLTMLRAMQNLASKKSMTTLLYYSMLSDPAHSKVAIQAMRAMQTMPDDYFANEVLVELHRVLFQLDSPHDASVRAMAYDVLLRSDPSEELLRDVFRMVKNTDDREVKTLFLAMTKEAAFKNDVLMKRVSELLVECKLDNYHVESQNGMSSAISRELSDVKSPTSLSFSNQLEIIGGLLKRSTVDVYLQNNQGFTSNATTGSETNNDPSGSGQLNLLNFGIFAGGLSTFGGKDAVDDGQEAHAGIEISLMGAGLRPITFFNGQGELLGHVWSGTGSERSSVMQGSILLQDHLQVVPLQNGLTAEMVLNGVISLDFAGQVQISLWNSNAHSLVEVEAASVIQGQVRVDNSFIQTMIEFNYGSQSEMDFISDLDFSGQIMMCIQMVQQDFNLVDSIRKLESIPGSNYALRKYKRKAYPVPGKTYVMNKKNTEFCNKMFR